MNEIISVGSLFSGIGGIELGLERTGNFRTEWFVENNGYARAVLRKHWRGVPIYDDVTQVDWSKVPQVDMLSGGFPCQDISYAGKGAGIKEGTRSGLWKEFHKAIRHLRPKFVLMENVSALLTRGLDIVLGDLASLGYDAEWHCITAASVGAPHRRDRIFIIAHTNSNRKEWGKQKGAMERGKDVSNAMQFESQGSSQEQVLRQRDLQRQLRRSRENFGGQWSVEPDVGRVAHGIPSRVDRIKCLGNAVVPQVAQFIGERITGCEG